MRSSAFALGSIVALFALVRATDASWMRPGVLFPSLDPFRGFRDPFAARRKARMHPMYSKPTYRVEEASDAVLVIVTPPTWRQLGRMEARLEGRNTLLVKGVLYGVCCTHSGWTATSGKPSVRNVLQNVAPFRPVSVFSMVRTSDHSLSFLISHRCTQRTSAIPRPSLRNSRWRRPLSTWRTRRQECEATISSFASRVVWSRLLSSATPGTRRIVRPLTAPPLPLLSLCLLPRFRPCHQLWLGWRWKRSWTPRRQ